ncbi:hypothetical protein CHU32_02360 [Superficieibacter electus]|uniref:Uncharacterized protein n=1 Tax=Superficieibacter electus TaxID=2022662 RepID=A0A2P5GUR0_9ENTR|nr:hypothetical protein [Superficieibacter electus]POP44271.1 hypothetical protein CHU33_12470 [Superficieibacter electus]POP50289.1 hypothetical protein CHU32_02360 [Superficieibacter electus]
MRKNNSIIHHNAPQPVYDNDIWLRFEAGCRRWGFLLLLLILIAGICGLFSSGLFSDTTATSANQRLSVDYERFARQTSDMSIKVRVRGEPGRGFTLSLGGDIMARYEIRTLQPQPQRTQSQNNSLLLEYPGSGPGEHSVWIGLEPLTPGNRHNTITLNGAEAVTFSQFIYP